MKLTKKEEVKAFFTQILLKNGKGKLKNYDWMGNGVAAADFDLDSDDDLNVIFMSDKKSFTTWENSFTKSLKDSTDSKEIITESLGSDTIWDKSYKVSEELTIFLAKIEFGNAVLLMILNAESLEESKNDDFKKCVQTAKNMSRQPEDLKTKINETAKNFKETLVGPIISGILLLLLSIIVFSARDSIYAFGTSGLEIPNFISGTVILAMAYFAYKQKITLTYFFMLFSAFWSIFGLMMDGEGYLFILFLLEVSIIIAISVRHKDFGYNHVKELFQESFKS